MSERVTVKDVRRLAERVEAAARAAGVLEEGTRVELQEGSQTNGRAWRLYTVRAGQSGLGDGFRLGDGYLGWSAREAAQTLRGMLAAFYLVGGDR